MEVINFIAIFSPGVLSNQPTGTSKIACTYYSFTFTKLNVESVLATGNTWATLIQFRSNFWGSNEAVALDGSLLMTFLFRHQTKTNLTEDWLYARLRFSPLKQKSLRNKRSRYFIEDIWWYSLIRLETFRFVKFRPNFRDYEDLRCTMQMTTSFFQVTKRWSFSSPSPDVGGWMHSVLNATSLTFT